MRCNYPNCRNTETLVPVIALPTIRTKGLSTEMVKTDKSTYMILKGVCSNHAKTYKLSDWVGAADWRYVQEAARANGYKIADIDIMTIEFKPIGWTPRNTLELERNYGSETSIN